MTHDELVKKAAELGFQLFEPGGDDANQTLAEVLKSRDPRFLEAFPVMLANAAEAGRFNYGALESYFKTSSEQKELKSFLALSQVLFEALGFKQEWTEQFHSDQWFNMTQGFRDKVQQNAPVKIGATILQPEKLKNNLLNYSTKASDSVKDVMATRDELGLEFAMSQIFTARQKELFLKKLRHDKMTKTEKEYFSRVVKKKAQALSNEDLHRLARKVLE